MKFGVIYDIEGDPIIADDRPPQAQLEAGLWEQTEEGKSEEHENWEQEKWCALLEDDQFRAFLKDAFLDLDGEGTALGPPTPEGYSYQPMPAFVFRFADHECERVAYVTPYPMPGEDIPGVDTFKRLPLFGGLPFDKQDLRHIGRHLQASYAR